MQLFFFNLHSLETFTRSLRSLSDQESCTFCSQSRQWVSHGYVYKYSSSTQRDIVGKRILCSDRHGKQGCGRTRQLYLASVIPRCQYRLIALLRFILSLLNGATITHAYHHAIGHDYFEPRQAYRWLAALHRQLGWFRSRLDKQARDHCSDHRFRSQRLNRLLPSLQSFLSTLNAPDIVQHHYQRALI